MVPLVDFVNCDADPSAECQRGDRGEINLVTRTDLPANSEVTLSYGAQSQEQSLFTFGFFAPGALLQQEAMGPSAAGLAPHVSLCAGPTDGIFLTTFQVLRVL